MTGSTSTRFTPENVSDFVNAIRVAEMEAGR